MSGPEMHLLPLFIKQECAHIEHFCRESVSSIKQIPPILVNQRYSHNCHCCARNKTVKAIYRRANGIAQHNSHTALLYVLNFSAHRDALIYI